MFTEQAKTESFVQKLVETRGPQWQDPEVIAKGKLEADNYIKNLEDQLTQMRQDLGKEDYSKQLLTALQNKAADSNNAKPVESNTNNVGTDRVETKTEVSEEILERLVEQTLTKQEAERSSKQNQQQVLDELGKRYGTEADAYVRKKATELGISMARVEQLAAESPTAFFALLGDKEKPYTPIVNGSINTQSLAMQRSSDRDWAYYQNLRKTNKKLYYDPKTQRQLLDDKNRLGSQFGN